MTLGGVPVQALEAVSSIALTAMSTIVAGVALVFTYRQNVGWEPVLLVSGSMLSGVGGQQRHAISLQVEFWNRRKYPVALRDLIVSVEGVKLLDRSEQSERGPFLRNNRLIQHLTALVAPHEHSQFDVRVEFENQSLDAMTPMFSINVSYFDAHRNKDRRVHLVHRFFYPELGWKKSAAERVECERVYAELYRTSTAKPSAP